MRYEYVVVAWCMVLLLSACQREGDESPSAELTLPDGFRYEVLHSPMAADSSSWVALAVDGEGRLIASDQFGALYRVVPPPLGSDPRRTQVERIDLDIGRAQGLLWAFGSLYVVVNNWEEAEEGRGSGLFRVTDTDGDDEFDRVDSLMGFDGSGEHGPHSIILGPDSASLYIIAGNHTELPEVHTSRVPRNWAEDQLLPVLRDPRGHAADRQAPGGWVLRTDPDGANRELFSVGYRNAYDLAFNAEGDLFTFDSDMEWDLGMPWYRPIRVVHVTSGSEFGWRTGSGKWPAYYPDNLPAAVDIGQGSPTGVVAAGAAHFPMRYRRGLFVFDWSFGTIYWVALRPSGSTYEAVAEEFLSGVPLPVTDGVIGADGALYFATGGRRLNSFLYRVWYERDVGKDSPLPRRMSVEHTLRRNLESLHGVEDPKALREAWPHLDHADRFVRWAARVAIEHQPVSSWAARALGEPDPLRRLYAIIALARSGGEEHLPAALEELMLIEEHSLSRAQQLDLLRAYGLVIARWGLPEGDLKQRLTRRLVSAYPEGDDLLNRERGRLLVALQAPGITSTMVAHLEALSERGPEAALLVKDAVAGRSDEYGGVITDMRANMPSAQEIDVAMNLRHVRTGWTLEERRSYLQWFYDALRKSGGRSYVGFIEDMRDDAVANIVGAERDSLMGLIDAFSDRTDFLATLPQPEGPGKSWNRQEFWELLEDGFDEPRDFAHGKRMYAAALCSACHRLGSIGVGVGPDLTMVGTRFGRDEILEAIDSPSDAVSDRFAATLLELSDGNMVTGRVVSVGNGVIRLNQNPYDPSQAVTVQEAKVVRRTLSPVSIMPSRLLDRLNGDEVLDLLAFLVANGDSEHKCFTGDKGCNTRDEDE